MHTEIKHIGKLFVTRNCLLLYKITFNFLILLSFVYFEIIFDDTIFSFYI